MKACTYNVLFFASHFCYIHWYFFIVSSQYPNKPAGQFCSWIVVVWNCSTCVSFVLVRSRKNRVDFTLTMDGYGFVAVIGHNTFHSHFHSKRIWYTEHAEFQFSRTKFDTFYYRQNWRRVSKGIFSLLLTTVYCSVKQRLRECRTARVGCPWNRSVSAFCVHSIVSALIITHAKTQLPHRLYASPIFLI